MNLKKFEISKEQAKSILAGKRVVTYEDWDGDGNLDKIVTVYDRDGIVKKRKVKYGG